MERIHGIAFDYNIVLFVPSKCPSSLPEFNSKLSKLKDWLAPLSAIPAFNIEALPGIIEQLKNLADDILKLPRGLVILLRIIRHLAVAPPNDYSEGWYHINYTPPDLFLRGHFIEGSPFLSCYFLTCLNKVQEELLHYPQGQH